MRQLILDRLEEIRFNTGNFGGRNFDNFYVSGNGEVWEYNGRQETPTEAQWLPNADFSKLTDEQLVDAFEVILKPYYKRN